ncbi:MAG: M48 family metalloprotease [Nitrospira sp.]|nr:M48 family metalloprotease [Nitrospira sp.]
MRFISLLLVIALLSGCAASPAVKKEEISSPTKEMGKAFVAEALQHYQFIKDPDVTSVVNRVGQQLVKGIGSNPSSYHFMVVHEDQPNAFAIPGGYIFVFDSLLLQIKDENELAGVLAHEMGHVERNHFFKDTKKTTALDIATIAAILLGGGNIAAAAIASAANIDLRLQFSRENESEADTYALRYLQKGGYSPKSLLNFFDSLLRYERFNPQLVPAYLSTHPDLESRRDIVYNFVMREPVQADDGTAEKDIKQKRLDWKRVITVINSLNRTRKDESLLLQAAQIDEIPEADRGEIKDYLLGVAYMKEGRFNDAVLKYTSAIGHNRENPVYYGDLAYCYLKQQDVVHAREAAVRSIALKPDYAPAHVILGILDVEAGDTDKAIEHLEYSLSLNQNDPAANLNLAMAYKQKGDAARDAFYSARYFRTNMNPDMALSELKRAKGLSEEGTPLYFRIVSETEEIKREGL